MNKILIEDPPLRASTMDLAEVGSEVVLRSCAVLWSTVDESTRGYPPTSPYAGGKNDEPN
jgi:hypothetical protein